MDTAEMNQISDTMEIKILAAMRARVTYLRDKADSCTFVSVRRLLEEDMGLEKYALDVHKSFVKEHLIKCLEGAGNDETSENHQESEKEDNGTPIKEVAKLSEEHEAKTDVKDETGNDEKMKGSLEMVTEDKKDKGNPEALLIDIRRALGERTSYIKANAENITMASLRRLLEDDLKLEKHSLDPFKKFIHDELDYLLQVHDAPEQSTEPIGKNLKKKVKSTPSKKVNSEENSDSDAERDVDDKEVGVKETLARKRKLSKSEMTDKLVSGKKKAKRSEAEVENDSVAGASEKPLKKTKETVNAVYGSVEHLKSVIKSCGMSVPPSIYKKAKQAPEEEREATLIEELEQILTKEGLSSDPSEKEIKEVKKRKTISKELEGIDTSNIVSSSRRRSTTSFAPPPKPKLTAESESESDEPEESENGEDDDNDEGGNEETEERSQSKEELNNEDDDDDEGGGNEEIEERSQSEEESNNQDDDGEETK